MKFNTGSEVVFYRECDQNGGQASSEVYIPTYNFKKLKEIILRNNLKDKETW